MNTIHTNNNLPTPPSPSRSPSPTSAIQDPVAPDDFPFDFLPPDDGSPPLSPTAFPNPPPNNPPLDTDDSSKGRFKRTTHPHLTGTPSQCKLCLSASTHWPCLGRPCDVEGAFLPPNAPPPPSDETVNDWDSFETQQRFCLADFLFRKVEMSAGDINHLLEIWAFDKLGSGELAPFQSCAEIYETIDAVKDGDAPWQCMEVSADGDENSPSWMQEKHQVWYRDADQALSNQLANPDFDGLVDYSPYIEVSKKTGKRHWSDFMSANYAWTHSVRFFLAVSPMFTDLSTLEHHRS